VKRLIKKYYGAILFYSVIVIMILLADARFEQLNQQKSATESTFQIAQNQ